MGDGQGWGQAVNGWGLERPTRIRTGGGGLSGLGRLVEFLLLQQQRGGGDFK